MRSLDWTSMFYNGPEPLIRTAVVGVCAYFALVFFLRVSGKRTMAQLNSFDFIVSIAIGSILSSLMMSKDTVLAQGLVAFALLIMLQWVIAWLAVRSKGVRSTFRSEPTLVLRDGQFLRDAMQSQRILEAEIRQVLHSQGMSGPEQVELVILEPNGSLSVIGRSSGSS